MSNTTNNKNTKGLRHCSFCNRNEQQVEFLIPSPTGAYICNFCVEACNELITEAEAYDPNQGKLSFEVVRAFAKKYGACVVTQENESETETEGIVLATLKLV